MEIFSDLLAANKDFASAFKSQALTGQARKGLAIVTCMDSRIDPLHIVGMEAGDAKILRNAGARVTDDVLRTLVLATHLLGVNRILVMPHTDCRMASATEEQIHATILEKSGVDTRGIEIRTVADPLAALKQDLVRVESYPLLAKDIKVMGAIYDVATGLLNPINN
jgi:carbonic anhydrase